jgi:hypothetical protein
LISLRLCHLVMLVMGNYKLISLRLCHLVMLVMGNYHWFPSDFVTWSCWLREIIIDFPQTLSLGHVGYGKLSLISLRLCHLVMLATGKYHVGYIQRLKEEWVLLFVLVISIDWKKSVFCCLFWLYPETERRVSFVVCFSYIHRLKEECILLFVFLLYP